MGRTTLPLNAQSLDRYNYNSWNIDTEKIQQQRNLHSKIHKVTLSTFSVTTLSSKTLESSEIVLDRASKKKDLNKKFKKTRTPLGEIYNLPPQSSCITAKSSLDVSEDNAPQHNKPQHKKPYQRVSQHKRYVFRPSSKAKKPTNTLFPPHPSRFLHPSVTSVNSVKAIPPTSQLSATTEPPDSDIAQLWDLVRVTVAQKFSQTSTSITTSRNHTMTTSFTHGLGDVTPDQIDIPKDRGSIPDTCKELEDNYLFRGKALYGSLMDTTRAKQFAKDIKLLDPGELGWRQEIQDAFFNKNSEKYPLCRQPSEPSLSLPWLELSRSKLADNSIPPSPPSSSSPPDLQQLKLQRLPGLLDLVVSESSNGASEKRALNTFSFGLNYDSTFTGTSKIMAGYLETHIPTVLEPTNFCADFLYVIYAPNNVLIPDACKEWTRHTYKVAHRQASIWRANQQEDKKKALQDMRIFGYIFHRCTVTVLEMGPILLPRKSKAREKASASSTTSHNSTRSSESGLRAPAKRLFSRPRSTPKAYACRALGTLDISDAASAEEFAKLNFLIMRWGHTCHCASFACNLIPLCWRPKAEGNLMLMGEDDMKAYWTE